MSSRLASLLDREQDQIVAGWASALSRMRPSAYAYRPVEELRRLARSYLVEVVAYLDSDDPSALRSFIHREASIRLGMGFGTAEVVRGFVAFREVARDLCATLHPDLADQVGLLQRLIETTDFAIVEFVTHYQALAEERTTALLREAEEVQRVLVEQAIQDPVTELFTARFFDEHLSVEVKRAVRYGKTFSLAVLDLDNFAGYRARYGEAAADAALRAVADLLRRLSRDTDLKARTGEAEFGIAMAETPLGAGYRVAERLRTEIAAMTLPHDPAAAWRGELTVSVGLGAHPDHGSSAVELLQRVREARDRARFLGGDTVVQADDGV